MKNINKFLEKNIDKIFIVFLFLQPIIDVLTAIMLNVFNISFTIGEVIRILFLLFMVYYLFILDKSKTKKKSIIYLIVIFLYSILFLINIIYTKDLNALTYELKNLIKCFYFPILLISCYEIFKEKKCKITPKLLKTLFVIYLLLIFLPNILGIGFESYQITKSGSIGLFYTANEIGAIISILLPIYFYIATERKNNIYLLISIIVILYTLTSMGTKGPLLSFILIGLYYLIKYISKCIKIKQYKSLGIISLLIIIIFSLGVILIPKTNFYKNILVHLEFLHVEKISDLNNIKVLDHFVFSQRLTFLNKTNEIYQKSSVSSKLLGIGYIDNYSTDEVSMKMIEMDYFDIFYRHGIIGFIIFMTSFIYFIYKIIIKYYQSKNINRKDKITQSYMLSLGLALILSLLTGHVITSPSVSIYVALIINLFYNELYKGVK